MNDIVYIYGAGGYGHSILPSVKNKYPNQNLKYVDGNPSLWGTEIEGIPVISPEVINNNNNSIIVIASIQGFKNISKKLNNEFNISTDLIDVSFSKNIYDNTFGVRESFLKSFSKIVYNNDLNGSCAEGGVFEGDFAAVINKYFPDRKLYLFDTFEGFDERDLKKENVFTASRVSGFNMSNFTIDSLMKKMENPNNIQIRKGFFPETVSGITDEFIFVNLDFDLYEPTIEGLKYFYPRMKKGGIILVHDYFSLDFVKQFSFDKVKSAVDKFCSENSIIPYPIGDRLSVAIIKE